MTTTKWAVIAVVSYILVGAAGTYVNNYAVDLMSVGISESAQHLVAGAFQAIAGVIGTIALVFGVVIPTAVRERVEGKNTDAQP